MKFQASKLISKLLLVFYLGFCSARPSGPVDAKIGEKGILIKGATCEGKYYHISDINNAVNRGVERIRHMKQLQPALEPHARYNPVEGETLPFLGPYYPQIITTSKSRVRLNHVVIFTTQGLLANVVFYKFDELPGYEDCRLDMLDV